MPKMTINSDAVVMIYDCSGLQSVQKDLLGTYELAQNINCSASKSWNNGAGFLPIGQNKTSPFRGSFNGNDFTVNDLYINQPKNTGVGLFGVTKKATIMNIGLLNPTVMGYSKVGNLVGWCINSGIVNNTYVKPGQVSGSFNAVGGLIGQSKCNITRSFTKGSVVGYNYVGGLVGTNYRSVINAYSRASVTSSHAYAGGLVGSNQGVIGNAYSKGSVNMGGGLVGLKGDAALTVDSFWDITTSGRKTSSGGTGKITAEMKNPTTYVGWNFNNIWQINQRSYPAFLSAPVSVAFKGILSTQQIGIPFLVQVSANIQNFNCSLTFYSARGPVDPQYADMTLGAWSGNMTVYSVGEENYLELRWTANGYSGSGISMDFDVVDQSQHIPNNSSILGAVQDALAYPLANATVYLYEDDPALVGGDAYESVTYTDVDGTYRFEGITPDTYHTRITKTGYSNSTAKITTIENQPVTSIQMLNLLCSADDQIGVRVPVLLVPGIMGSKSSGIVYPRLPFITPSWDDDALSLLDPFGTVGWEKLKKLLGKRGYSSGCSLFDVTYDWTLSITEIRDQFLLPWISHAKIVSGCDQVDIISHSMGGLVVRSYIQSSEYVKDVRKFAMVGTPNLGSDRVYTLWEGGDPIQADQMDDPWWSLYFYTNTLYYLYKKREMEKVCKFNKIPGRTRIPISCKKDKIYRFVHEQVLSSGQLMPIYGNALTNYKTGEKVAIHHDENMLLKALNGSTCFNPLGCLDPSGNNYNFVDPASIFTSNQKAVQTYLYAGEFKNTISTITVKPQAPSATVYQDGKPKNYYYSPGGDGTVLDRSVAFSASFPPGKNLPLKEKKGGHGELIKVFSKNLLKFITSSDEAIPNRLEDSYNTSCVFVEIQGRIQPFAQLPSMNSSQNIETVLSVNNAELTISNVTSGRYIIDLSSPYQENYDLAVGFMGNSSESFLETRVRGFYDQTLTQFSIIINESDPVPVQWDRAFYPPMDLLFKNISSDLSSNDVVLSWIDPVGTAFHDVRLYQVYSCQNTAPYFSFFKSAPVSKLQINLNMSWPEVISQTFAVRSLLKNGKSTFLSASPWEDNVLDADAFILQEQGSELQSISIVQEPTLQRQSSSPERPLMHVVSSHQEEKPHAVLVAESSTNSYSVWWQLLLQQWLLSAASLSIYVCVSTVGIHFLQSKIRSYAAQQSNASVTKCLTILSEQVLPQVPLFLSLYYGDISSCIGTMVGVFIMFGLVTQQIYEKAPKSSQLAIITGSVIAESMSRQGLFSTFTRAALGGSASKITSTVAGLSIGQSIAGYLLS